MLDIEYRMQALETLRMLQNLDSVYHLEAKHEMAFKAACAVLGYYQSSDEILKKVDDLSPDQMKIVEEFIQERKKGLDKVIEEHNTSWRNKESML